MQHPFQYLIKCCKFQVMKSKLPKTSFLWFSSTTAVTSTFIHQSPPRGPYHRLILKHAFDISYFRKKIKAKQCYESFTVSFGTSLDSLR